jgi:RNA polymerase sigma factor (sigma-70 family)
MSYNYDLLSGVISENPVLSSPEQIQLVKLWQESKDKQALDKLTLSNIRAVSREAWKLTTINKSATYDDLMQEGISGLLKAASMFDENKNANFLTYAMWWVKAMMRRHVMNRRSIVRLGTTADDRIIFSGFSRAREKAEKEGLEGEDKLLRMADILNVKIKNLRKMYTTLAGFDSSLDEPVGSVESDTLRVDLLEDESSLEDAFMKANEDSYVSDAIASGMEMLSEQERYVITQRFFYASGPKTLRDLGDKLGVSREWVRQVEMKAMSKLRRVLARDFEVRG